MASPLESKIKKTVGKSFKNLFLNATLTRETTSGGDAWNPASTTTATYTCKAIHEEYSEEYRLKNLVDSLAVDPKEGDKITIRGATFTIKDAKTDPATATWTCRACA